MSNNNKTKILFCNQTQRIARPGINIYIFFFLKKRSLSRHRAWLRPKPQWAQLQAHNLGPRIQIQIQIRLLSSISQSSKYTFGLHLQRSILCLAFVYPWDPRKQQLPKTPRLELKHIAYFSFNAPFQLKNPPHVYISHIRWRHLLVE